jgi:predicted transcriptional regulator
MPSLQSTKLKSKDKSTWTFFSNHGHAIILLSRQPDLKIREIATEIGLTERAMIRIINDLVAAGYLFVKKSGRRNYYRVNLKGPFRHSIEQSRTIGDVVSLFKEY